MIKVGHILNFNLILFICFDFGNGWLSNGVPRYRIVGVINVSTLEMLFRLKVLYFDLIVHIYQRIITSEFGICL